MRRMATFVAAASLLVASAARSEVVREAHYVMGTVLEITVDAPARRTGQEWIRTAVAEVRRLDRELTSFDDRSALSRFNRASGRGFQVVPPDLFRLVARAKALSARSGGVFDVSVGPLVALWANAARHDRWPRSAELAGSRSLVGYEKILLRPPDRIGLAVEGMTLGVGGIGKGYAVDRVIERLGSAGVERALVSFGESSIRAIGAPAGEDGWPVWVRRGNDVDGPIRLRDRALSTSRSRGRVWRVAGRPVGHILDPRTGFPLDDARQGTVLASTATRAEVWSKVLLLEPARAFTWCGEAPERACLLLDGGAAATSHGFADTAGWTPR